MSREQFELLQARAATAVPEEVTMGEGETIEGAPPRNEAIIAGIMAAVKEIKFRDLYGDQACDLRSR
jgi:hypothetical protein